MIVEFIALYSIFGVISWIMLASWLHSTNREFTKSWTLSFFIGALVALVWPMSLAMVAIQEFGKDS